MIGQRDDDTPLELIQAGIEEFHRHGFVILENAIDPDLIDRTRVGMIHDAGLMQDYPERYGIVFNNGVERTNFSMTPDLNDEELHMGLWGNRHAAAIMQQIIGPRPQLRWASSNVAIPSRGNARQAVHSDAYADILPFPSCIEVNIYLNDNGVSPENGSTEIWPGTHVFTEKDHINHGRGWIKKSALNKRARVCPPIQPTIPKGSLMLRDFRLWHAGMPNPSEGLRIMLSFMYFPSWFQPPMRLTLQRKSLRRLELWHHVDLISGTRFVDDDRVAYLRIKFPMNFTQVEEKELVAYRREIDRIQGREPNANLPVTEENYWVPPKEHETRSKAGGKRKRGEDEEGEGSGTKGEGKVKGKGKGKGKEKEEEEKEVVECGLEEGEEEEVEEEKEDEEEVKGKGRGKAKGVTRKKKVSFK